MDIIREKYLINALEKGKTYDTVLLSGLRGCGKTTLLNEIARCLRRDKPPVRVVEIKGGNIISTDYDLLEAARALGAGISALIIDNAENIENLLPAIVEIHKKYKTTIYLSGEKTLILEEILKQSTTITYEIIKIHSFSYKEFLEYHSLKENQISFIHYLLCGGIPRALILPCTSENTYMIQKIYADSFILENIIERFSIRNPSIIRQLLEKIAKTQGTQISSRAISESFAANRITVSNQTVIEYLEYCRLSGLLEQIPVIDIKTLKTIEAGSAWYFTDNGLRNAFVATTNDSNLKKSNIEKAFENALYCKLTDQGYTVTKGRISKGKDFLENISFICTKNNKKFYIQISPFAAPATTQFRKRESLLAIHDAWPKYLIGEESEKSDGIITISARKILHDETLN
ncbi:MAG: ATP-binding protein [Treponema sp.]|nr:ATP-binding protein [Treponema sp.]